MKPLIILKWKGDELIVDEDSLHHFGTDIPVSANSPQGVYEIKVAGIKTLK